jgi:hypothetical protein
VKLDIDKIEAQTVWIPDDSYKNGSLPMGLSLPFPAQVVRAAYGGITEDQCILMFTPLEHADDPQWSYQASFKIVNNKLAIPYMGNETIPATLFFDPQGRLVPEIKWVPGNEVRLLLLDKSWQTLNFDRDQYQAVGVQFMHPRNSCSWPTWKLKKWESQMEKTFH